MAETIWNSAVSVYHFMMDNLVVINILLSLVIVFFQRRSPQTVWTWLLLLYFIPILGFVLYLLIGQDFHKSRMFKAKEIEGEIKYAVRRQEETIYRRRLRLTNPAVARYRDLILYNLEAGQAVLTDNNDVRIYTDGKEKFKALLEEMQKAKKYIPNKHAVVTGNPIREEFATLSKTAARANMGLNRELRSAFCLTVWAVEGCITGTGNVWRRKESTWQNFSRRCLEIFSFE